jgi:hypothetical protein
MVDHPLFAVNNCATKIGPAGPGFSSGGDKLTGQALTSPSPTTPTARHKLPAGLHWRAIG